MRCSHFLQPSTTCCGSPPGRRSSTAGRGRASPAGCSPPCRRDWRLRSRRMGDEQRVSWPELLAQSRDDFEAGTDFTFALLFDPLVDACLLINTRQKGGKSLQKMRVLVLTDYYPLKLLLGQMSVLIGQDWA